MRSLICLLIAAMFLVSLSSCSKSPEKARKELGQMNIDYTDESFKKYVERGDRVVVDLFLTAGMNPNLRDSDDVPVLFFAVAKKQNEIVNLLVEKGADVNSRTKNGLTPLMIAALTNQIDIMKSILKHGADINAKTSDISSTAIILAKEGAFYETLVKGVEKEHETQGKLENYSGLTSLMIATFEGNEEAMTTLIENGADINLATENGLTALLFGIATEKMGLVKILLEKGANPNSRTSVLSQTGFPDVPPLYFAIRNGDQDLAKTLLEKGADANSTVKIKSDDNEFISAPLLITAISYRDKEITQTLIDYGADVNTDTNYGSTALEFAEEKGLTEIIVILRKAGAKK